VIPVFSRRLSMAADVASVQFSRTVERRITPAGLRVCRSRHARRVPRRPADAGLSKLNSMLGSFAATAGGSPQVVRESRQSTAIQPGSVDMLGPVCSDAAMPRTPFGAQEGSAAARIRLATDPGPGHR